MLIIRKAVLSDAESIAKIHADTWRVAYHSFLPQDFVHEKSKLEARLAMWNKFLSQDHDNYYVAENEEKIAGFFSISEARDTDLPRDTYELISIYFADDCWHKGYGSIAMRFIINQAKERGYKKLSLWAFEDNTSAIRFYERFGFRFDGKRNLLDFGKTVAECRYQLQLDEQNT